METELERLIVRLVGDGSSYQRMIEQAQRSTAHLAESIQFHSQKIAGMGVVLRGYGSSVGGLLAAGAGVLGAGVGIGAVGSAVSRAADLEENRIAFGTLLQDMEKGKKLVKDMQAFTAATPLNTPDIQAAAKTLLQFGAVTEDDIIPTLRMLGDVTGGNAERFRMISLAFGQVSATGHLMGQDLLQMINAGFNPLKEISRTTGKSMDDLRKDMEHGKISVEMVREAFRTATGAGGAFFGLMEKQSQTLKGLFSTLKDDVGMALAGLGEKIAETFDLRQVLRDLSKAAQESGRWVDFLADEFVRAGKSAREFLGTTGVQAFRDVVAGVKAWIDANQKLVLGLALTAGAVATTLAALKLFNVVMGITLGIAGLLKLDWIASVALLAAYAVVMGAAKLVMLAFSAAQYFATVATLGLDAAIAVLTAELVVPLIAGLAAAAAMATLLAAGFVALGVTAYSAWKSGSMVLDVLLTVPTNAGPIRAIGKLFEEWGDNLKRVAKIAETDLPAAFELLKLQAQLAVSQVKDLWGPLTTFIVTVTKAAWEEVKANALIAFADAIHKMWNMMAIFALNVVRVGVGMWMAMSNPALIPGFLEGIGEASDAIAKTVEESLAGIGEGKPFQLKLKDALKAFADSLEDSPETQRLKKALEDAFALQDLKQKWRDQTAKMFADAAGSGQKAAENLPPVPLKLVPKFDAAAWNSAELASRIQEFNDRIGLNPGARASGAGAKPIEVTAVAGGNVAGGNWQKDLLTSIAESLKGILKKENMTIVPANLDGQDSGQGNL